MSRTGSKGTINILPQGQDSSQYSYVQRGWSCQRSVQQSQGRSPHIHAAALTGSTPARYRCQTLDLCHQCPQEQCPLLEVLLFSVSCTQTLFCPSCHLRAVKKKKKTQTESQWVLQETHQNQRTKTKSLSFYQFIMWIWLQFYFTGKHLGRGPGAGHLQRTSPPRLCIWSGCFLLPSAPGRWRLSGSRPSSSCPSSGPCSPQSSCSGRWWSETPPWTGDGWRSSAPWPSWTAGLCCRTQTGEMEQNKHQKDLHQRPLTLTLSSIPPSLTCVPRLMSAPNHTGLFLEELHQDLRGMLGGLAEMQVSPLSMLQKTWMASSELPWFGSTQYSPGSQKYFDYSTVL